MKNLLRLYLPVACGLMLVGFMPAMAEPNPTLLSHTPPPHGAVWEEWQPLAEGFVARRRVPEKLELPKEQRRSSATQGHPQTGRERLPWDQMSLWFYNDAPGLYSICLDEVSTETGIGFSQLQSAANSGRLSFFSGGEAVSWYYDAARGRLLFAGEAYETFHAEGNAYQLRQRRTPDPQRMIERGNSRRRISTGHPTPFRETLRFEEEAEMMFMLWLDPSNPDARYWFWDYLYGSIRPQIQIPLDIPDPAASGTARICVRLHGFTDMYPGDDHLVSATLNGFAVGSPLAWDGLSSAELLVEFDQALFNADGANTLTLHSEHDASRPFPGQLLESIAVEYLRLPVAADNGQLWMRDVAGGVQEVTGFNGPDILVIESPVRNAVLRGDVNIYNDRDGGWAVAFETDPGNDYLIAQASSVLIPTLDAREQADLTTTDNSAHYLIIAPRVFAGTAQALAESRQMRYGPVKVVWLDDIFKNFSAGRADPFAIGRFMDHVRTRWSMAPSAVTLIGKGSLDRKDRMGYGDNFLPVLMTSNPWAIAASDARLLGVEDGVAPFAIGRLPITNDVEGLAYVDKLSSHDWQSGVGTIYSAVIVADDPDMGGNFHADADRLAAQLQRLNFASITKLYHPSGKVQANLTRSGIWESDFISYSGHGGTTQLGNHGENFLNNNAAAALNNTIYPVFAALTCTVGSDALPGTRSLMSTLVLNPQGGAIAVLAPSGASLNKDAHILGSAFIDHLFGRYLTVGESIVEAKQVTRRQIKDFMAPIYSVIGDPAVSTR
jgi:hypothetical protein